MTGRVFGMYYFELPVYRRQVWEYRIAKEAYFKYNQVMETKVLVPIFEKYPQIKLVYFFGSRAKNKQGPLSDFDFAVYLDERDSRKMFELKLALQDQISKALKTDKVDIVILNTVKSPELKFNIIKDGRLILKKEPYKVLVEPRILNEYFDFHYGLVKYGLTKANKK